MLKISFTGSVMLTVLMGLFAAADAQVITGTISGVTRDETGGVLPGVTVTVKNLDTGINRTVVTNESGRYAVSNLSLGNYAVSAELVGFQTLVRSGITLTIGREAVVDLTFAVSNVQEQVLVSAEASLIDTTGSTLGGLVDEKTMRDLPLNARSFTQLAALQPGVLSPSQAVIKSGVNQGFGQKLVVHGARPTQNTFLMDGADMSDGAGSVPGSAGGNVLGVESVREFKVLTNNVSAEYGRAAGAVFSAVTKSGTNAFRGSVFEFYRNDAFDATNFFVQGDKPDFTRHQFGFSLGGPIVKGQTFFFGNYEGLRERLGLVSISNVPNALAREGQIPIGGQLTRVTVNPSVSPILALYPLPNGRDLGDGRAELHQTYTQPTDEDFLVGKVDHKLADRGDSLFLRYSFNEGVVQTPQTLGLFTEDLETVKHLGTFELTNILRPHLLNVFRLNVNRSTSNQFNQTIGDVVLPAELTFVEGRVPGTATPPGVANLGYSNSLPRYVTLKLYEFANSVTYSKGIHSLRMGGTWKLFHTDTDNKQNEGGEFTFGSLSDWLSGRPRNLEVTLPGSDTIRKYRQNLIGLFVQNDMRVRSNLTLNLGLRYEFITVPIEADGKESTLRDPRQDTGFTTGQPLFKNPSLTNFAPRAGFSWDPRGSGKMAVRGGFGVFHDQLLPQFYSTTFTRTPPFFARGTIQDRAVLAAIFPRIPAALLANTPPGFLDLVTWTPTNPYTQQFNLNVQRELRPGTVLMVGYVGTRGHHLMRAYDVNAPIPERSADGRWFNPLDANGQPRPRRNPVFGPTVFKDTQSQSFYNGFVLNLQRRVSEGLQLQVAYTYSRSVDDSSNNRFSTELGGDIGVMQIGDCRTCDRGLSAWDARQNAAINFTYELPSAAGGGAAARALLDGWQLNGVVSFTSGTPVTAVLGFDQARSRPRTSAAEGQRPNLVQGASNSPVLGGPDRYFDPLAFELQEVGFFGDLGRNTIIGPGLANVDFALVKNSRFSARRMLQVRVETFNLLNRTNFGLPQNILFTATGRRGDAGRISTTATTARQIQLGLKFLF